MAPAARLNSSSRLRTFIHSSSTTSASLRSCKQCVVSSQQKAVTNLPGLNEGKIERSSSFLNICESCGFCDSEPQRQTTKPAIHLLKLRHLKRDRLIAQVL